MIDRGGIVIDLRRGGAGAPGAVEMDVPPPMGSANAINFQSTDGGKAAMTADFVLIAKEVNTRSQMRSANSAQGQGRVPSAG